MSTVDEYLDTLPTEHQKIAAILREHLTAGLPETKEQLWHGHPVWMSGKDPIAGFKEYPRWVSLLLWKPSKISDPDNLLTPSGGTGSVLTLKLTDADNVDTVQLDRWISQLA